MNSRFFSNLASSRKFRRGSFATVITVMVVVILVLLNMLAAQLSAKFGLSLDLTAGGLFTITEETQAYLGGLSKDVQIYVLNSEQNFTANEDPALQYAMQQANEIIKKYEQLSPRIRLRYVDIVRDPGFVNRYGDLQPTINSILLESGDQVRLLLPEDLFNWQSDSLGYYITSSKAEQTLSGAIVEITSDESIHAAVLNGHAESQASGLASRLLLNNYRVSSLNTLSQEIPGDIDLLIISAPLADYQSHEIEALERFLYNGGSYGKTIFYLAAIDQPELPVLDAFLARWGVRVNGGVVFETNRSLLSENSLFFTNALYAEESYSKIVQRSGLPVTMPNARPLEAVEAAGVTTAPLLIFSNTAGIRAFDTLGSDWTPSYEEITGPYPALLLSQKSEGGKASSVLAASTSLAVEESVMATVTLANSRYFLSLLGSLTYRADNVVIENKTLGAALLNISYGQALVWGFVFFVILPLTVLVTGVIVFIRRRHM